MSTAAAITPQTIRMSATCPPGLAAKRRSIVHQVATSRRI